MRRFKGVLATLFVMAMTLSAAHADEGCDSYLRTEADGNPVGVSRIESLKGMNVHLYDVSQGVRERRLPTDKRINIFKLDQLFSEGRVFLGFGMPNVFLAFPPEVSGTGDWAKFAAKSFKRADSKIENTRGFAQSGILIVFKDLAPEKAQLLYEIAKKHEGSRHITCVNANCRVLEDAGFTVGGEAPSEYILPGKLLEDVLRHGLELNGDKVEYDIIRVNPGFLEQVGLAIDRAVGTTFCRHAERDCEAKEKAGQNVFMVFAKKQGRRVLNLFLGAPKDPREKQLIEAALTRLPPSVGDGQPYGVRVSEPTKLGTLLRLFWGPHTLFELSGDKSAIDELLPAKLKPFPNPNPSFVTKLKKTLIFSRPVVGMIRSQLADSYREFTDLKVGQLYDMTRTHTEEMPNKYNIVVLGDRIVVMKIGIKMAKVDWVLSKHLILSGYEDDVRFAGEFYKAADGSIHLTRNSGTYQPSLEQLKNAAILLQRKFPGVTIVIDDSDPA